MNPRIGANIAMLYNPVRSTMLLVNT